MFSATYAALAASRIVLYSRLSESRAKCFFIHDSFQMFFHSRLFPCYPRKQCTLNSMYCTANAVCTTDKKVIKFMSFVYFPTIFMYCWSTISFSQKEGYLEILFYFGFDSPHPGIYFDHKNYFMYNTSHLKLLDYYLWNINYIFFNLRNYWENVYLNNMHWCSCTSIFMFPCILKKIFHVRDIFISR